jgi:hypothetical protein
MTWEYRETTGNATDDSASILPKIHKTNACEFLSFNFQTLESNPRRNCYSWWMLDTVWRSLTYTWRWITLMSSYNGTGDKSVYRTFRLGLLLNVNSHDRLTTSRTVTAERSNTFASFRLFQFVGKKEKSSDFRDTLLIEFQRGFD